VHEQIAHGHLARHVGIRELERRDVVDDGRVPPDLPLVHEDAERRRGEGLGVRRDAEQRPVVHGRGTAERLHAVAARDDDLAVLDDGKRDAGHLEGGQGAADPGVEIGRRALRRGKRGKYEEEQGRQEGADHGANGS
jgi:hypothetical protein